jgi:hypothetical protein
MTSEDPRQGTSKIRVKEPLIKSALALRPGGCFGIKRRALALRQIVAKKMGLQPRVLMTSRNQRPLRSPAKTFRARTTSETTALYSFVMSKELWTAVDRYLVESLIPDDPRWTKR